MKTISQIAFAVALIVFPRTGYAVCGDVTGDDAVRTSDALAVLKSAVGQSIQLTCKTEVEPVVLRHSRGRLFNGFGCPSGSDRAELRTDEGQFFAVDSPGAYSSYQTLNTSQVAGVTYEQCGLSVRFPGPLTVAPERKFSVQVLALEDTLYGPDTFFLAVFDEGPRSGAPSAEARLSHRSGEMLYGRMGVGVR